MLTDIERPGAPDTLEAIGVDLGVLAALTLKTLYLAGNSTVGEIADRLALPPGPTLEILRFLRGERLCEIIGGDGQFDISLRYTLTEAGFARTASVLAQSGYIGPAPVPLADYVESVKRQSVHQVDVRREDVEESLSRLVFRQETVNRIGQAFTSKRATLLYGASGNGKSSAADALRDALAGDILIPYAIEVAHQVIQLYDPSIHELAEASEKQAWLSDRRWVLIRRPALLAAGELAANHLELLLDEASKTYQAPIQTKANGGLLVIDDFGRQRLNAAYLLNRWIVPLEKGIDSLSLHNGIRFEVPFDVIPLFLTNRRPAELADEAFLRRIRYKIEVPAPDRGMFMEILRRECRKNSVAYDEDAGLWLVSEYLEKPGREMRGCQPRDIVDAIVDAARYQGTERRLTPEAISAACATYFV